MTDKCRRLFMMPFWVTRSRSIAAWSHVKWRTNMTPTVTSHTGDSTHTYFYFFAHTHSGDTAPKNCTAVLVSYSCVLTHTTQYI